MAKRSAFPTQPTQVNTNEKRRFFEPALLLYIFQFFLNPGGDGAVGGVGTGLITAVHFQQRPSFRDGSHHTAVIDAAAIAADK